MRGRGSSEPRRFTLLDKPWQHSERAAGFPFRGNDGNSRLGSMFVSSVFICQICVPVIVWLLVLRLVQRTAEDFGQLGYRTLSPVMEEQVAWIFIGHDDGEWPQH